MQQISSNSLSEIAGRTSTPPSETNPPGATIQNRAQATRIRSEMREQRRSTSYGEWMVRIREASSKGNYGPIISEMPATQLPSPFDRSKTYPVGHTVSYFKSEGGATQPSPAAEFHTRPAHKETIMFHLQRLSMHRHLKGDKDQGVFLLADYTRRLCAHQATELQVFDAVEHFIENDTNGFFPTYAKLHKEVFGKIEKEEKARYED